LTIWAASSSEGRVYALLCTDGSRSSHIRFLHSRIRLFLNPAYNYVGVNSKKTVYRILLNALDPVSVKRALSDLRSNKDFQSLKESALARQRADWLIGMNGTRAFTLTAQAAGHNGTMNVGRVKSVIQALVVSREREIQSFKPIDHYGIKALFEHTNGQFAATWIPSPEQSGLDSEGRLIDKVAVHKVLDKFMAGSGGIISKYITEEKKESPKLPFSLSALQIAASKKYGMSPQQVLDATQALYDKKHLSYPRSGSDYLPESQHADAPDILSAIASAGHNFAQWVSLADPSIKGRAWLPGDDKRITPHHAIIPTRITPDVSKLSPDELTIYCLVSMHYVIQFCKPHVYNQTIIEVSYQDELLRASGRVTVFAGWREILGMDEDKDDKNDDVQALPVMAQGDSAKHLRSDLQSKTTQPPKRFTKGSLVQAMKEIHKFVQDPELKKRLKDCEGIGTEATRARIIEELFEADFFKEVKKIIVPTDKAFALVDILPEQLKKADTTALWEDALSRISNGELSIESFMSGLLEDVNAIIDTAKTTSVKSASESKYACPKCQKPLRQRKGSKGIFWGCSGYPDCKEAFPDKKGLPDLTPRQQQESSKFSCSKCKKPLRKIKGPRGIFWGCTGYPECKKTYPDKKGIPDFSPRKKAATA
ncbi:MAG: DNA topoisomerase, partial [Nitrospirae bacterium]|nr:DNA topoisomerase [Nitrospirota bacterium]